MDAPFAILKFAVRYQGTTFFGWQKTQEGPSIQSALEKACLPLFKTPVQLEAASRTDRGVHAYEQIIACAHFEPCHLPLDQLQRALNARLPSAIQILHIEQVPHDFHPTLQALKKEYLYQVCNTPYQLPFYREFSWHIPKKLDIELMQEGGRLLLGTHDFSAFCNERALWTKNPVCTLEKIEITQREEGRLFITYIGDHFLYKMVRNLTGTLVNLGLKTLSLKNLIIILEHKDRSLAPMTAPAHGLYLNKIYYLN